MCIDLFGKSKVVLLGSTCYGESAGCYPKWRKRVQVEHQAFIYSMTSVCISRVRGGGGGWHDAATVPAMRKAAMATREDAAGADD